ncbi:acyl-coenzyme A synthetase/AMP-(fatty) acid ligase/3-hydroxymyristoyl/3-hydroxydecanoyl-(acyl carrier protein) dehydratase [Paraburkholderia sp. GAS41]|jgi:acyl-coenzyme A synthetase/AMP-(fatty) acid ligase/3-hydroxymyristoyl/3-hydroxydecanoyl-(acyl carrier protein) dehydratase|uniref:AMP-binding protein n=1 Tax=Paraburkholderia sp. GAS41 TaxID=3035134 RepID=UPI003D1C832D
MPSLPLLFHSSPAQTIAWRDGSPVSVCEFLADVTRLAKALPEGQHVFNMCTDRYRFAVGLCATLVAGKISLLPSAHTPEAVRQLASFAPDTFCLHDSAHCSVALPRFRFPSESAATDVQSCADADLAVPQIDATQIMAYLFTSGSTGVPVPHGKQWGDLVKCLRTSAALLGLSALGACTLVGTVPPQHMYGFENTVLLALIGGFAFSNGQPFYPGDVAAELAAVPQPRVLVTSPVHLRALMMSHQTLPPVALMVSATAPLAQDLARTAEARLDAPLLEIYGSTESGQIATRRTAQDAAWELYPEVRLEVRRESDTPHAADGTREATIWASGGHIGAPVPMGDTLELLDARHFLLHGRKSELINIAGKRTALGYLNHQLNEIPGVLDGVFFMPDEQPAATQASAARREHVTRLLALVVAPNLTPADLRRALRERIDAAFMPRPLFFVDWLPRNATGKLPRDVLTAMVAQHTRAAANVSAQSSVQLSAPSSAQSSTPASAQPSASALSFTIAPNHAALAGHFPGQPIVPGVVLLDYAISAIGTALNQSLDACRLSSAKFPSPAEPGTPLELVYETTPSGAIRFTVSAGPRTVASGVLAAPTPASVGEAVCS